VYGVPQKQAVQLAVDEVNQSDYLGDKTKLVVNFEDDAGDKTQAINAMTKLVTSDKVIAVIGPTLSSSAFAADPVAQENKTIVIGVSNTAIGLTKMGDFIFRDSLPEAAVIPGTIAQAAKILGLKQVGVLYGNDDDFTKSGYEVFKKALTDNKITIQGEETFARNDVDFNAQLTKLIGNNPDALVVSALAQEAVPIVVQARQLGYNGPIIGGNGFNSPAIAKDGGKAAEGVLIGGAWILGNPNPSKSSVAFVTAYNAAYNANPDQFAAQAYTGAWLLATAIRCGNSVDHTAVRDALAGIKDFESPLGSFSFDENRDPLHQPVVQVIKDGKYVVLAEEPAAGATAEPTASK
jgi:branched-chain amino acid transport system substrate-binding protein